MIYSCHSVDLLRPNRPRRGGRAAECGGLLNLPALFALADFHLFSVIYAAFSCAAMSTFAGYSAPRVHQGFVIAIRPRTGLERNRERLPSSRCIESAPEHHASILILLSMRASDTSLGLLARRVLRQSARKG